MGMYDPGWRRFEPTQEQVLVDVEREERAARSARGWRRLIRRLPWPLRVVLPLTLALAAPVVGLALAFGGVANDPVDPFEGIMPVRVQVDIRVSGDPGLVVDPKSLLLSGDKTPRELRLENAGLEAARVTITIRLPPTAGTVFAEPAELLLQPGEARSIRLSFAGSAYFANSIFFGSANILVTQVHP